jgi:hypothetical protein
LAERQAATASLNSLAARIDPELLAALLHNG